MTDEVHGIKVDYSRDSLFDELGMIRLKESYLADGEVSPQERFAFVSSQFATDKFHAQDYTSIVVSIGYHMLLLSYHSVDPNEDYLYHVF